MKGQRARSQRAHTASVIRNRAKRRKVIAQRRSGKLTPKAGYRHRPPRHERRSNVISMADYWRRLEWIAQTELLRQKTGTEG